MAKYNYEIVGNFTSSDRTSNLSLGTVEIDENDLTGGGRDEFLLGLARSTFGGKIAKEENRINGTLTTVRANRRGSAETRSIKSESGSSSSSINKRKLFKVFGGLFLIIIVWMFYCVWEIVKTAYWNAPKKSINWYKNFIRK